MRDILAISGILTLLWASGVGNGEGLMGLGMKPPNPWPGMVAGGIMIAAAAFWDWLNRPRGNR